jgi:hypothetical protein
MKTNKILLWSAVGLAVIAVAALAAGPLFNFAATGTLTGIPYGMGRMGGAGRMFFDHSLAPGYGYFGIPLLGLGGWVAAAAGIGSLVLGLVLFFRKSGGKREPGAKPACARCGETLEAAWVYCPSCGEPV